VLKTEFVELSTALLHVNTPNVFRMKIAQHPKHVSIKNAEILAMKLVASMLCVMSSIIRQFVHVLEALWDHHSCNVPNIASQFHNLNAQPTASVQMTRLALINNASIHAPVQMEFAATIQNAMFKPTDLYVCAVQDSQETLTRLVMKSDVDLIANVHQPKLALIVNAQILAN
jgi:hypothetical protein